MRNTVYCLASSEPQANQILTHLRNLGFSASEVSILLKQKDTKNISVKQDAIRGAKNGGLVGGALGAIGTTTVLSLPLLGPLSIAGPILAALGGAVAGGVVGGLAGGSGALAGVGIPKDAIPRLDARLGEGAILMAIHSD